MKKQVVAIMAALLMTLCVAAGILVIGGAALANKTGTAVSSSPIQNAPVENVSQSVGPAGQQGQLRQLQDLVNQYQARDQQYQLREKQYQDQVNQLKSQLSQDQQSFQQIQNLLAVLQQRGLINVTNDGRVIIN